MHRNELEYLMEEEESAEGRAWTEAFYKGDIKETLKFLKKYNNKKFWYYAETLSKVVEQKHEVVMIELLDFMFKKNEYFAIRSASVELGELSKFSIGITMSGKDRILVSSLIQWIEAHWKLVDKEYKHEKTE